MKITITQGDLENAQKDFAEKGAGSICRTCLVFQALKREGFPVASVAVNEWKSIEGDWIGLKDSKGITWEMASEWPKLVGETFETAD